MRDINLKLKNAERDQEFTRKKMQDNFLKDSNRRRENGKGGNRDHRHGERRNNWQDRNRRDQNSQVQQSAQESSPSEIKEEIAKTSQIEQAQIQKTASVTPSSTPELIPSDFGSEENMQHGRRFSSKRRFSSEESRSDSIGSENSSSEQMHEATQDNDSENSTEKTQMQRLNLAADKRAVQNLRPGLSVPAFYLISAVENLLTAEFRFKRSL